MSEQERLAGWETAGDGGMIQHTGSTLRCPQCPQWVPSDTVHVCFKPGLNVAGVGDRVLYRLSAQDMMHLSDLATRVYPNRAQSAHLGNVAGDVVPGVVVAARRNGTYNLAVTLDSTLPAQYLPGRTPGGRPGEFQVIP